MVSAVEWVIEERSISWLGQISPPVAAAAAAAGDETSSGSDDTRSEVEALRDELRRERNKLTTTDKVLIASLLLSVVSFAWGVYTWQKTH